MLCRNTLTDSGGCVRLAQIRQKVRGSNPFGRILDPRDRDDSETPLRRCPTSDLMFGLADAPNGGPNSRRDPVRELTRQMAARTNQLTARPQSVRSRFSNPLLLPTRPTCLTCNDSRPQLASMLLNALKRVRGEPIKGLVRRGFPGLRPQHVPAEEHEAFRVAGRVRGPVRVFKVAIKSPLSK